MTKQQRDHGGDEYLGNIHMEEGGSGGATISAKASGALVCSGGAVWCTGYGGTKTLVGAS